MIESSGFVPLTEVGGDDQILSVSGMLGRREPVPELAAPPTSKLIAATPHVWREPSSLPRRRWMYGFHYIRKFVSTTIAPGGLGKSSLTLVEALAMATRRNLLGVVPNEPAKVWVWNGEDPLEETERRVAAACRRHAITREELDGRLFLDSGRDTEIIVARQTRDGARVAVPAVEQVIATILANQIDVLIVDPFVSSHQVPENDNGAIDTVVKTWGRIAGACNCSIELVHHARKTGGSEITVEDGRGAVALLAGARSARVLNGMTKDEAERADVENPRAYFRVDNGKASMAPPPDKAVWYHLTSVPLDNGDTPADPGDEVAAVEAWKWPDPLDGMTVADLDKVRGFIGAVPKWRESPQSPDWVGVAVAEVLGLNADAKADKAKIKGMLSVWRGSGALKVIEADDSKRMPRKYVVAGDI